MKTEIDNVIKALEAFRAKLVEQEQPVEPAKEPDWVYLTDPKYVLRRGIDWCRFAGESEWHKVNGLANKTIENARLSGYPDFRCLRKDSPYLVHQEPEVKDESEKWVVQDRVSSRPHIDQWSWTDSVVWNDIPNHGDPFAGKRDGDIVLPGGTIHLRCRRKDLPALPEVAKLVDPEEALLAKAQNNAGDGVEVDSYHRLGWYRMAGGGIARIKRTYDEIACSIVFGDVVEAGSTFTDQVWNKTTGSHETNSDWNLIRWKGGEQ